MSQSDALVLFVMFGDDVLFSYSLPLAISSVRSMYRWLNIRNAAGGAGGEASSLGVPWNRPDAECDGRHFVFVHGYNVNPAAAQGSREYAFELSFPGTASNNVEIAFGVDADGDGALSVDEIGVSAGWDCGEWFVINAATGERVAASAAEGTHSLVGTIRLRTGGRVREISFGDGSATLLPAIQSAARSWAFLAAWNMVRLVGRGENVRSGEQFHVSATSHGLMFRLH